jgi:oligoendopeptidase F
MNWNLKDLYNSIEDLDKDVKEAKKKSEKFNKKYKNNLSKLDIKEFLVSLNEYQKIQEIVGKIMTYAFLEFATDSNKGSQLNKYQQISSSIEENLLFFELEYNQLDDNFKNRVIAKSKNLKYYLESLAEEKKYQLSEKEEKILLKKDITSSSAFSRLFDEHFSKMEFVFDKKVVKEEEVLSKLYSPDRDIRKKASKSLTKGLAPHQDLLAYIFNMIKSDHKIESDIRGLKSPEESRHISNKISQKSVDALVDTTLKNTDLVSKYYKRKAKILDYKVLKDYDRYAPIGSDSKSYDFESSKKIVLKAFKNFDKRFYDIAKKAFDENWCDVYPSETKRGGAFSHSAVTTVHPYVLLNHTNQRRDLFTLAHELGHAIHQYLSRDVGYLSSDTPLTTAETASVFAEMIVFDYIKNDLEKEELISLYASKLEDIYATLFRQIIFTTFERRVHSHDGEVSKEEFNRYWLEENQKMFGNSVKLGKGYDTWWSYIPHFIHSPFYCYAYSYGQLLVLALYGLYKSGDSSFKDNYYKFLSAGGSKSPKELISMFGFDIEDEKFWQIGLDEVKRLLEEFLKKSK